MAGPTTNVSGTTNVATITGNGKPGNVEGPFMRAIAQIKPVRPTTTTAPASMTMAQMNIDARRAAA